MNTPLLIKFRICLKELVWQKANTKLTINNMHANFDAPVVDWHVVTTRRCRV